LSTWGGAAAAQQLPAAGSGEGWARPAGKLLLAAAVGYEGEAAVVALAHIMRSRGASAFQACVAASQQHATFMVRHFAQTGLAALLVACCR
jgi:hypothetical protein